MLWRNAVWNVVIPSENKSTVILWIPSCDTVGIEVVHKEVIVQVGKLQHGLEVACEGYLEQSWFQ